MRGEVLLAGGGGEAVGIELVAGDERLFAGEGLVAVEEVPAAAVDGEEAQHVRVLRGVVHHVAAEVAGVEVELVELVAGVGKLGDHLLLAGGEAGLVVGDLDDLPAGGALGLVVIGAASGVAVLQEVGRCGRAGWAREDGIGGLREAGDGAGQRRGKKQAERSGG